MQNLSKEERIKEKLVENNKNKNGKVKYGTGLIAKVEIKEDINNDTTE